MPISFPWADEARRIAANFVFWLVAVVLGLVLWACGAVDASTPVPQWLGGILTGVLDIEAIGFVIVVTILAFALCRWVLRSQSLARAVGEEASRVFYAASAFALCVGLFFCITHLLPWHAAGLVVFISAGTLICGLLFALAVATWA